MNFTEELLHYFWKTGFLKTQQFSTVSGEPLQIIHAGFHNTHAGPDFENALIEIGATKWAGNVEMHLYSSDWFKHRHEFDEAYQNVILHVVYEHDRAVFRKDGTEIPVLELKSIIPFALIKTYKHLMAAASWVPCAKALSRVDECHQQAFLNRVMMERLAAKQQEISELLTQLKGSWDDTFYIYLAKHFGFKTNALPFECLAKSLPQQILAKHKNKSLQIEALIFGQAGLLGSDFVDDYPAKLKVEYDFLRKKYGLKTIEPGIWKYMRLRPANFPTIRLAQFSALVIKSMHLFSKILAMDDFSSIRTLFSDLPVHPYWEHHYLFESQTERHSVQIGSSSIQNLLINVVVNFLFSYGKYHAQEMYCSRAIHMLEHLPAENNLITRNYHQLGLKAQSALASQALISMKKNYCDQKKCLFCGIGSQILQRKI